MLNTNKMAAVSLIFPLIIGRAAIAVANSEDVYYAFEVRGDDALTQNLTNALEGNNIGFHRVAIDKADATTIVVFLTDHLKVVPDPDGDQVRYNVEFSAAGKLMESMDGQCPIEAIQNCKASILQRLRELARRSRE